MHVHHCVHSLLVQRLHWMQSFGYSEATLDFSILIPELQIATLVQHCCSPSPAAAAPCS